MTDSLSILISNYNSYEAIQLCIESVRRYSPPDIKIIVYNDDCFNGIDDKYLREGRDKGWIELHENLTGQLITHGGSLNKLVNEICRTDYAIVMDNDIQIKARSWIDDMFSYMKDGVLAVCDWRHECINNEGYVAGFYRFWLGLINMTAYRDGMQVDWMFERTERNKPPYDKMFLCLDGIPKPAGFNENLVQLDPGSKLWVKVFYDNPKGYRVVHLPLSMKSKFYHHGHISALSAFIMTDPKRAISWTGHEAKPDDVMAKMFQERMAGVRTELQKLRNQ